MDKEYLIKKWLENDLSKAEAKAFAALEDAAWYEEIVEHAQGFSGEHHARVLPFEALENKITGQKSSSWNWLKIATRIAAVFVIAFGLYMVFDNDDIKTFQTNYAQVETIRLPDNSEIKLNELSRLEYNASTWDEKRELDLEGEAFFDVEKGKRFDVNTMYGTISVLGTQFNVSARDSIFSVICYEGLVQVFHDNTTTKLPAGKAYRVKNGVSETFDVAVIQPEWLQNMKVFDQASVEEVFAALEAHYNIKITLENIDKSMLFTGAFELDNLDNALMAITQSLNLTYQKTSKTQVVVTNAQE
ncbi:FecR family protein [Nonlabens marinus]|uniref:Putative anti-sigma factor n=1 Tax=Nonlabens marinus S1-08 TaxID=1454201 RepID=W8VZY7_9FLAO|nr:FecR family protein [Nonlabens marinus]BAO55396.1 putative anti-sigma factor [Nonlabens marinus S1-08]